MSRLIIDIGNYSNDGTGNSIRDAFDKINENFRQLFGVIGVNDSITFSNLSDAPASYSAGQIISASSSSQLAAKTLVAGSNISIVNTASTITINATVPNQPSPTSLTNPLNTGLNVIGKSIQPSDINASTGVQAWNTAYHTLTGITLTVDDLLISKKYADSRYIIGNGSLPIPVRSTPTDPRKIITGYNSGNVIIGAGHNYVSGDNGTPVKFNSSGVVPSPLVNGTTYYIKVVDSTTLELYPTSALTLGTKVVVSAPVNPGLSDVVCLYPPQYDITLSGTWNANEAVPRAAAVLRTGDTMEGELLLQGTPTSPLGAVPKSFVQALTTDDITEGTNKYYSSTLATADAKSAISTANTGTGYGSLSYLNGVVSYTKVTNSDIRSAFVAGAGINIDTNTGEISVANLTVPVATQARHALSVTTSGLGSLTYDIDTGQFAYTGITESLLRSKFSAASQPGTRGNLKYSPRTGQFTYTGVTDQEIRGVFSAGTGITLSNTGVISSQITQYTDTMARQAISLASSTGNGTLSYNGTTGEFNYAGITDSAIRAKFSAGTGVALSQQGVISIGQDVSPAANVTFNSITATTSISANTIHTAGTITADGGFVGELTGTASSVRTFSGRTTDDLAEGNNSRYYTDDRVYSYLKSKMSASAGANITYNDTTKQISVGFSTTTLTTSDVAEGTSYPVRLYFTDDRAKTSARNAFSINQITASDGRGAGNLSLVNGVFTFTKVRPEDISGMYSFSANRTFTLQSTITGLFAAGVTGYNLGSGTGGLSTTSLVLGLPTDTVNPITTNIIKITDMIGDSTLTLPVASGMPGVMLIISNLSTSNYNLSVKDPAAGGFVIAVLWHSGTGSSTSGNTHFGQSAMFVSDGENWLPITGAGAWA